MCCWDVRCSSSKARRSSRVCTGTSAFKRAVNDASSTVIKKHHHHHHHIVILRSTPVRQLRGLRQWLVLQRPRHQPVLRL